MSRSILVADDSPENLELLVFMLKSQAANYQIIRATNGRDALKKAVQSEPDLILLDWDMPEMNGIEAMEAIHQMKSLADIPVIIATAFTSSENLREALEKGAVDFLKKPIDSIELMSRVRAALRLADSYKRISSQKEKIELQRNELEAANDLKDKLFSVISHDMKGPLHSLTSLLDIFINHSAAISVEELTNYATRIRGSLNGVNFLLANILKWSLSQMNKVPIEFQYVNLHEIVEANLKLFLPQAQEKSISINASVHKTQKAWADYDSVDFVIRNLLANAVKFTNKRGAISLTATELDKQLQVSIQDTGVGISAQNIGKILESKAIFSTAGTASEKGTGLGLNLCKEFIEKNKGQLFIESKVGEGTTIRFTLPLAPY